MNAHINNGNRWIERECSGQQQKKDKRLKRGRKSGGDAGGESGLEIQITTLCTE